MDQSRAVPCWDFFDKGYCISLEERPDRRDNARRQFQKVGMGNLVEFVVVKKDSQDSEKGIYESHMACIRKGLGSGANTMLIFEDDIVFDRFCADRLARCVDFLTSSGDWQVFFLGCIVSRAKETWNPSVLEIEYRTLAHAYALNRPFAEALVSIPWQGVPFDSMLRQIDCKPYAMYPAIAFQGNTGTDNQRFRRLDKYRRLCGGLRTIQKMNELYHQRKMTIIALHILAGLLLMKLIF